MTAAVTITVWLLAAVCLFAICWRSTGDIRPLDPLSRRIARIIVLAWAAIVVTVFVANLTGQLNAASLLVGPPLFAFVAWRAMVEFQSRRLLAMEEQVDVESPQPAVEITGILSIGERLVWAAGAALAIAIVVRRGLLTFPRDWDSLAYHLPLIDHWLREGNLYVPACAFWYVPGNNEILGLWIVAPFSGDYLVGLNNLSAVVLLSTATYSLAKEFTSTRFLPSLAAAAVLVSQPVGRQMFSAENDVAVASLVAAATLFGMRFVRTMNLGDGLTATVAIGLLAGVKYYALGYAAAVTIAIATGLLTRRGWKSVTLFLALTTVSVTAFAGYWYLRNTWWTGSPLFPKFLWGESDLWSQMRPGVEQSSLFRSGRAEVWPMYVEAIRLNSGPLGIACVFGGLLWAAWGVLSGAVRAFTKRRTADTPLAPPSPGMSRGLILAVALALSSLVLGMTPNLVETAPGTMNMIRGGYLPARFSLSLIALGAVAATLVLDKLFRSISQSRIGGGDPASGLMAAGAILFGSLGSWQAYDQLNARVDADWAWLAVLNLLGIGVLALALRWRLRGRARRLVCGALASVALAGIALGCRALEVRWREGFAKDYVRPFRCLPRLSERPGRICVCDYRYYPWFGSQRQHDVSRPLFVPDYDALESHLRQFRSNLLVTLKDDHFPQKRYAGIADWIRLRPGKFTIVYEDRTHLVARVRLPHGNRNSSVAATEPGGPQ